MIYKRNIKKNLTINDCHIYVPLKIISAVSSLFIYTGTANAALPDNGWIYDLKITTGATGDLCINAKESTPGSALADIVQSNCNGANNQRWKLLNVGGTTYKLTNQGVTNTCLTVTNASTANGAAISRATCTDTLLAQKWNLIALNGSFQLQAVHSGKCLVVSGASTANGAALIQYECKGGANEQVSFRKFRNAPSDKTASGQWGPTQNLGLIPSSAAVLPNGRLLYWSGSSPIFYHTTYGGTLDSATYTGLLKFDTPQSQGTIVEEKVVDTGHEMFCPGLAMTADGRILAAGGGIDLQANTKRARVSSYNYSNTVPWQNEASMSIPRWYNTAVTLTDGTVFTAGGDSGGSYDWRSAAVGDVWNPSLPAAQSWRKVGGLTMPTELPTVLTTDGGGDFGLARAQYYRKFIAAPNGKVLEIAPNPNMVWHDLAANSGQGLTTAASTRPSEGYDQGTSIGVYEYNKVLNVLMVGGARAFGDEDPNKYVSHYRATTRAYTIDLTTGKASLGTDGKTIVPDMHFGRYQANSVVMPDGKILTIGGAAVSALFDNQTAIMAPEMYDPKTNTWSDMAPHAVPRMYHSVALLLPDARVWAGGGGQCGTGTSCTVNHKDAEIFSPPYLFNGSTRPVITAAVDSVGYGTNFTVTATGTINRFTLVRLSAVTHSTNTDQRMLEVVFTTNANGTYTLTAPANKVAPPGYYMLFALNPQGTPSVAKIMKIS